MLTIREYLPTFPAIGFPKLATPQQLIRNALKVGVFASAIFALYNTPKADAGPIAYGVCMAACTGATLGGFLPACIVACAPALAAPTP